MIVSDKVFTEEAARTLLAMNAAFGTFFLISLILTVFVLVRREINDLFMSRSMIFMVIAQILCIIACFIITSYNPDQYLDEQTVPFQQAYFEVPFYCFLIVATAVLFSWYESYRMYDLQCQEDELNVSDRVQRQGTIDLDGS